MGAPARVWGDTRQGPLTGFQLGLVRAHVAPTPPPPPGPAPLRFGHDRAISDSPERDLPSRVPPKGGQTGIALCGVSKGRGEAFTSDGAEAVDTSDRIPDLEFDF